MIRYFIAGESHGPQLTTIIEGVPAGLHLTAKDINVELKLRQSGYGRGGRMKIEADQVTITSGVRHGLTLGSPITLTVPNRDYKNWQEIMATEKVAEDQENRRKVTRPRPGHADLVGGMKYGFSDLRNVLERSSARETVMHVAVGAVAKRLLTELGIELAHHIVNFGGIALDIPENLTIAQIREQALHNDLAIIDETKLAEIHDYIDETKKSGNTLGGIVEVRASGVPAGLGSYVQYDRKLDAKIAAAVISINAFKGVEFGLGFEAGKRKGSEVMDEITWSEKTGYERQTDRLGGFEGGMTNGQDLIIRGVMKPIPTLAKPLQSVDIETHEPNNAAAERSDVTALPAASVIMESVVATVLAQEICEQFTSDNLAELKAAFANYKEKIRKF